MATIPISVSSTAPSSGALKSQRPITSMLTITAMASTTTAPSVFMPVTAGVRPGMYGAWSRGELSSPGPAGWSYAIARFSRKPQRD